MTAIKEEISPPAKLSARDKAIITDETARAIISAETSVREEKTERLRQLRLQREAAAMAPQKSKPKIRKSTDH